MRRSEGGSAGQTWRHHLLLLLSGFLALFLGSAASDLPIDEQPFPIVDALTRHFEDAAARGELRAGLGAEAAARVCLTSVFALFIGRPSEPAQRRADFGLLFSLYLAEEAP